MTKKCPIFVQCHFLDQSSYHSYIFLHTWALHIGHVFSLSNHVVTHSSQKICLQCNFVGSDKLSWQIGQVPPVALSSSWLGLRPYLWKIKKGYLEKSRVVRTLPLYRYKGQTISKANYGVLKSPKKRMKLTILSIFSSQDSDFCSFSWRIKEAINCFWDLLTFNSQHKILLEI